MIEFLILSFGWLFLFISAWLAMNFFYEMKQSIAASANCGCKGSCGPAIFDVSRSKVIKGGSAENETFVYWRINDEIIVEKIDR